jgi:hypothetical protein
MVIDGTDEIWCYLIIWIKKLNRLFLLFQFTVKPDVRFRGILQHCWEYCNFDCKIALSKLQLTWSNCKLKFTIRFVNKVSDWLLVAKKNQSNTLSKWIGSSLLPVANQRLCLQIWLWISTCNLITSVATCSEQSRNQNCNIPNNVAIFRGNEHPVWL